MTFPTLGNDPPLQYMNPEGSGPTAPALVSWALLIVRHKPALVLQENVSSFPVALLQDLLGNGYRHDSLMLDPRRLCWPVARARRYTVFARADIAPSAPCLIVLCTLLDATSPVSTGDLFAVERNVRTDLSVCEYDNLTGYDELGARTRKRGIVDLSQNPRERPRGSTIDDALCTLTCSSSRLWVCSKGRCLAGSELLLAQGFPAFDWAAQALGLAPRRLLPATCPTTRWSSWPVTQCTVTAWAWYWAGQSSTISGRALPLSQLTGRVG